MDQDTTWHGGRLQPRRHCVRWVPSSPTERDRAAPLRPMSIVAKRSPISATAELLFSCFVPYMSSAAEMGDHGHKRALLVPFAGGREELGPSLTQCGLGRGLLPYQMPSSCIQPFGHNRHGPKIGWGCSLFCGGELGPYRTQSRLGRSLHPYQVAS